MKLSTTYKIFGSIAQELRSAWLFLLWEFYTDCRSWSCLQHV